MNIKPGDYVYNSKLDEKKLVIGIDYHNKLITCSCEFKWMSWVGWIKTEDKSVGLYV